MDKIIDQPAPVPNDRPAVWDLVIADMKARDALGRERYGTPLQPFNGRDPLVDAYQEALDLAVYLRQAIAERDEVTGLAREQAYNDLHRQLRAALDAPSQFERGVADMDARWNSLSSSIGAKLRDAMTTAPSPSRWQRFVMSRWFPWLAILAFFAGIAMLGEFINWCLS